MTTATPLDERVDGEAAAEAEGTPGRWSRVTRLTGRIRIGPVLPARLRPPGRPMPWVEIALVGICYYFYRQVQDAATSGRVAPFHRGFSILRLEHTLHFDVEHWLNHKADKVGWLMSGMNYYYATLHFIVPIAVLVWVCWKFPERYRAVRTVIFATTALALIGFYFYALCPPRLLIPAGHPGAFIDTFCTHHTWGKTSCDGVGGLDGTLANQYAAMPSLHIGWAVWCAVTIAQLAERTWVKVLGILYPFATLMVILCTANHYVLDAVFGLVTLAGGFLVQRILLGRPVFGKLPTAAAKPGAIPRQPDYAEA